MSLASMLGQLVELEDQISAAAEADNSANAMRVYEWRPTGYPELPAIWNWIDDGSYDIDDTARATDSIVITVTIGVRPADLDEVMGRLVTLTDIAIGVLDPALWTNQPLGGTAKRAKRLRMATRIDEFLVNDREAPVMCMDLPIEVHLSRVIGGAWDMPDNSGRPDLKLIAQENAARRQPSIVIGTGTSTPVPPGDTYIPVFRQETQPDAEGPWLWLKTDPGTGETVDIWEEQGG